MLHFDFDLGRLEGGLFERHELAGRTVLVVNVASRCGLTPQYAGLEQLQQRFASAGFIVLGVPCNQFAHQEPEGEAQIQAFCSVTYGTSFPMTEKLEVNGPGRHQLYRRLVDVPDKDGRSGDVLWNFEKFLISATGEIRARFSPWTEPASDELVAAIESVVARPSLQFARRWERQPASDVRVGDRVRPREGFELMISRIEPRFPGREGMLAFIESSDARWLKVPVSTDDVVEVLRHSG